MRPLTIRRSRVRPALFVGAILWIACACREQEDPRALVEAAIEAHGGRERLATFDNVKVVARGRFKQQVETTGTISFVAPFTWAIEARVQGNPAMLFGMDGERCWRRDRQFVSDCSSDDAEYRRFGKALRLRLLHGLEEEEVVSAGERDVGGTKAPAVRAGDFVLAFDPQSHRLIELSTGNRSEVYSDFRTVNGAVVAARRTLFIDGAVDVEDTWDEILPGEADLNLLHPPAAPKDGDTREDVEPERWMVTTRVPNLADLSQIIGSLDDIAGGQGQKVSASEGFVLTQIPPQRPGEEAEWEISIGLEPTTGGPPSHSDSPFRFERWPAARSFGVFHLGDLPSTASKRTLLEERIDRAGLQPEPGSRLQVICTRESLQVPPAERLCVVRLTAVERGATAGAGVR